MPVRQENEYSVKLALVKSKVEHEVQEILGLLECRKSESIRPVLQARECQA